MSTDPKPWKSDCQCKGRFVHKECLLTLLNLQQSDHPTCSVCTAPYRNVSTLYVMRHHLSPLASLLLFVSILNLAMVGCTINTTISLLRAQNGTAAHDILLYATILFTCASATTTVTLLYMLRKFGPTVWSEFWTGTIREYRVSQPLE